MITVGDYRAWLYIIIRFRKELHCWGSAVKGVRVATPSTRLPPTPTFSEFVEAGPWDHALAITPGPCPCRSETVPRLVRPRKSKLVPSISGWRAPKAGGANFVPLVALELPWTEQRSSDIAAPHKGA